MTNSKRDFIKDFFVDFPNKETLKNFIDNELPLNSFDKKFLTLKYCDEKYPKGTPVKVMAYNLGYYDRYIKELNNNIITRALPYINIIFIKALSTSLKQPN